VNGLRPEFVHNASTHAVRAQYEHAQALADLWSDRARDLFLLLCEREDATPTMEDG
jgi:hypothetical protein